MTTTRREQQFNLVEFYRSHWKPTLVRLENAQLDSLERVLALFQWADAVGWATLGVDLQLYDSNLASSLLSASASKIGPMLEEHRHYIEDNIPAREVIRIQELINTGTMSSDHSFSEYEENLGSYFFTGEALSQLLNQDDLILQYQEFLLFGYGELPSPPVSISSVVAYITDQEKPSGDYSAEEAVAAFVKCISAMGSSNDLFRDLRLDEQLEIPDRVGLERRMGQLNGWRFSLNEPTVKGRFERTRMVFYDALHSVIYPRTDGFENVEFGKLDSGIELLIEEWIRNHPFHSHSSSAAGHGARR